MKKKYVLLIGFLMTMISCSVESSLTSKTDQLENTFEGMNVLNIASISAEKIKYTSDLTNVISYLPTYKNLEINRQNSLLKFYITDYIYAIQERNLKGKSNAYDNFQKCYKKLQKLKQTLDIEDQEYINRYLVKIKTNMTMLESLEVLEN